MGIRLVLNERRPYELITTSYSAWRHWGCVTPAIIKNMKQSFEEADELDGFDDLKDKDKERIRSAWKEGKVADEDIPESARGGGDEVDEEDKPKKKKAPAKKKAKVRLLASRRVLPLLMEGPFHRRMMAERKTNRPKKQLRSQLRQQHLPKKRKRWVVYGFPNKCNVTNTLPSA